MPDEVIIKYNNKNYYYNYYSIKNFFIKDLKLKLKKDLDINENIILYNYGENLNDELRLDKYIENQTYPLIHINDGNGYDYHKIFYSLIIGIYLFS